MVMPVKDSQIFLFLQITLMHLVLSCVSADNLCPETGALEAKND